MLALQRRNGSLDETMDGMIAGEDLDMVAGMNAMDAERRAGQNEMPGQQFAAATLQVLLEPCYRRGSAAGQTP
jgi:pyrimidine deaminase RibD-like protein